MDTKNTPAVSPVEVTFACCRGIWYLPRRQSRTGAIVSQCPSSGQALADLTGARVLWAEDPSAAALYLQSLGYCKTVFYGDPAAAPEGLPCFPQTEDLNLAKKELDRFLNKNLSHRENASWLRLDNAAKIYPAALRRNWSSLFRLSVTLTEPIDKDLMQKALDLTVRRFPSICTRLRKGLFWYYLQALDQAPRLSPEYPHPLTRMPLGQIRQCGLRVIVYENRLALEIFHSLTDGSGAMIFLKSLLAEYLQRKHGITVPTLPDIPDRMEAPRPEELEDSFQKHGAPKGLSRKQSNAWRLRGTPEKDGFVNLTCFSLEVDKVRQKAKEYGVGVTAFLGAVMMQALQTLQAEQVRNIRKRKSIKVQIPVNLRSLFPSRSLRNFAMYTTPEIQPRLGQYSFREICAAVHHRMGLEVNAKHMGMMITANVSAERVLAVRLMPLFLKNIVMRAVFDAVGERKYCLAMSNLGKVTLPEVMAPYVRHWDFIVGVQATAPYNCGVVSYGNELRVNFVRSIRQSGLELHFHKALQELGLQAQVSSNQSEV